VRVPKVLTAGALGNKHLHVLFCRKWNKRPRNSSRVPPDGRKQWRWSCDVLVESVLSLFLVFPAACLSFSPSFFLFSSFFLFFLFYCQSSLPHSNTGEWRNSLFSAFFYSVFGCFFSFLSVFLLFYTLFFSLFLLFSCRLLLGH